MNKTVYNIRMFRAAMRFMWKYLCEETQMAAVNVIAEGYVRERDLGYL